MENVKLGIIEILCFTCFAIFMLFEISSTCKKILREVKELRAEISNKQESNHD